MNPAIDLRVLETADLVSQNAAEFIAGEARNAVAARGRFVMAVSGGKGPWTMFRDLARENVPWDSVHIVQVDERVAPAGDPARNLTHLRESLLTDAPLRTEQIYAMPVESADLNAAAGVYAATLQQIAGRQPVLDLIHLGIGPDGHTASLVPGDPVLTITNTDVAITGIYEGHRRMTLTYPMINRARKIFWLITGSDKVEMLHRLLHGDQDIPAGHVRRADVIVFADRAAAC